MSGAASEPLRTPAEHREAAIAAHQKGDLPNAQRFYTAYLASVPGDAPMWSNLGALLRKANAHDLARIAQERAYRLNPEGRPVRANYANILNDIGETTQALEMREALLKEHPDDPELIAMVAKSLRTLGRHQEAVPLLRAARKKFPDEAELTIQQALTELTAGNYRDGFRHFRARWQTGELTPREVTTPEWTGDSLEGRRILVLPEQGFGDTIAMLRFLPALRRFSPAHVQMLAEGPMRRLLNGVPGVDELVAVGDPVDHDVWVNLMDLPAHHFEAEESLPDSPPLNVPQDSRVRAQHVLRPFQNELKVGVVWTGSQTYRGNAFRSFTHRELVPLAGLPGVQLFSLYKGPRLPELHADGTSTLILDLGGHDRDLADCAGIMQELDLVISTCTVTAHLAGALGCPTWTLLHWDGFWMWKKGVEDTPWYPSMRLFRQKTPRDWPEVIDRVGSELAALRDTKGQAR